MFEMLSSRSTWAVIVAAPALPAGMHKCIFVQVCIAVAVVVAACAQVSSGLLLSVYNMHLFVILTE